MSDGKTFEWVDTGCQGSSSLLSDGADVVGMQGKSDGE